MRNFNFEFFDILKIVFWVVGASAPTICNGFPRNIRLYNLLSELHFLPPVCDFVTRFTPSKILCHVLPCTCNDVSSFTHLTIYPISRLIGPTNDATYVDAQSPSQLGRVNYFFVSFANSAN